jgi:spore coat polysaccharide biosynthesis protein SpsF
MSMNQNPRVVAIVQARMGSTRLPGKVLKPIAGKPLLWHVVHRLSRCKRIDQIAIATTTNPRDEAIVEFGRDNDIVVIRGPEEDVLARFALAAEATQADMIVRVSSDAPFLDAGFIDHLVGSLIEQGGDYVLLEEGAVTAHEGVDPFSRRALNRLMAKAHNDPVAREHVTGYFKLHPDFAKIVRAPAYPALAKESGRLTIDTPDDLAFIEAIHERIAARAGEASLSDLLLLLEREPQLRQINAHVRQKAIAPEGGLALIRCDGGGRFGLGHVKRMVALARALRDREGIGSVFAVNGTEDALAPITRAGFEAQLLDGAPDAQCIHEMILGHAPDFLICDMREGVNRRELFEITASVPVTVVIDDGSDRRLAADVAYYPPVPQALTLDWSASMCAPRIGWEWSLLGTDVRVLPPRAPSPRPTLLVTMGGCDPAGLTVKAARALAKLKPQFRARFVIGPAVADAEGVARKIETPPPNFEIVTGAYDLATEIAACDVALCAFGVTAYELAAYGVPAIYLCLTDDHALSASAFEQAGMGLSLGVHDRIEDSDIAGAVLALLSNGERGRQMRVAGLTTIDGNGAARIAADLKQLLNARQGVTSGRAAL